MCGIYGYIGKSAVKEVFSGIKRLEYRGYDSAGIAVFDSKFYNDSDVAENIKKIEELVTIKSLGELKKLERVLNSIKTKGKVAIGHTRWATHGKPSLENCHPHISSDGNWALVHNGIIENYKSLKENIAGVKFKSETDTEVVVHLLEKYYNGHVLQTIKKVCDMLKGSFAFAIITKYQKDEIFVARMGSPVAVGINENTGIVCSDLNSIVGAEKLYLLENNNYAVVEQGTVTIYDKNLQRLTPKNLKGKQSSQWQSLGKFKHYMKKEICEAPLAIENTIKEFSSYDKICLSLPAGKMKKVQNLLIIGCGTAYHAGLIGKTLFEQNGIKCETHIASEFRYSNYITVPNTLAIFVSQSGETADTIEALRRCKNEGIDTLAITNVKNSSITFEADYCLYTNAGAEIGVASTKAYDCQLVIFYLLSSYFKALKNDKSEQVSLTVQDLLSCAEIMRKTSDAICKKIADIISDSKSLYMIGRGQDYYVALEASLKLKEVSYIHSEAYAAGELKHGTISLIEHGTKVFAFVTEQKIRDKTVGNIHEVLSRGGEVIALSEYSLEKLPGMQIVKLPKVEEKYMPLIVASFMQRVAYYTSVKLGHNPDKPRSLAKSVTVE